MDTFTFTGDWNPRIQLANFLGREKTNHFVTVCINDELNDTAEPLPEQVAAINYVLQHEGKLRAVILDYVYKAYPGLRADYGGDDESFPKLNSAEDLVKQGLVYIHTLHVHLAHRDGMAYVGFEGGCRWDSEHGVGLLLHRDNVLTFGGADTAILAWIAEQYSEAGDHAIAQDDADEDARWYSPHPVYGLKPSQRDANYEYLCDLIRTRENAVFIEGMEAGVFPVDLYQSPDNMSLLQYACSVNNDVVIRYYIGKKPESFSKCIHELLRHYNKDMIMFVMDAGADINEYVPGRRTTPLGAMLVKLADHYRHGGAPEVIAKIEDMIVWLLGNGANPYAKTFHERDGFGAFDSLRPELAQQLRAYLAEVVKRVKGA